MGFPKPQTLSEAVVAGDPKSEVLVTLRVLGVRVLGLGFRGLGV